MPRQVGNRGRYRGVVAAAFICVAAIGCGDEAAPIAPASVTDEPAGEPAMDMGPLPVAPRANPSPVTGTALADAVARDARLLVITADGKSAAFAAISKALDYLGTPYDVFTAKGGPDLTADRLADGGDHQQ